MDRKSSFRHGLKMPFKIVHKVIDGFSYICNRQGNNKTYVRCQYFRTKACKARGKLEGNQFTLYRNNNHPPIANLKFQYTFEKALYTAVTSRMSTELRKIYDAVSLDHPIAAISLTWAIMQPKMQKWRATYRPPFPQNWQVYAKYLNMAQWFNYTNYKLERLIVATIQATDGSHVTAFSNPEMLRTVNTETLFIDSTFKVVPPASAAYQFMTILALVDDTAIPIFWALMEKKTTAAYLAALTYFHEILTPHIEPTIVMTDFESSLLRPIRAVFPRAIHKGCYFHFCQALIKNLKDLRLFNLICNWHNGQILIRKLMALPLLPSQVIAVTFYWLVETLPNEIKNVLMPFAMVMKFSRTVMVKNGI